MTQCYLMLLQEAFIFKRTYFGEDLVARKIFSFSLISFLCLSLFVSKTEKSYANSNEDLTPEKLVAAHVKSIGDQALLATIQSRMFVGSTNVDFIQGSYNGTLKGNALFISEGPKLG